MKLRLILGDQLSKNLSSLNDVTADDIILMCEVRAEATYVKHHKKKIAFLFSAMRHFAHDLRSDGLTVHYTTYDDPANAGSLLDEVQRALDRFDITEIIVTEPGEYRLLSQMRAWSDTLGVPVDIRPDDRFLATHTEFENWAAGRKQLRMEYFYREMRRKHDILMDGEKPIGGQWNFDDENLAPPTQGLNIPDPYEQPADDITREVMALVDASFSDHFGDLTPFHYAVTREGALDALDLFINTRLAQFGTFQDAMIQGQPWMFHSHIALYLNCGLLTPSECIRAAERAYHSGDAPLNAVEGFVRQILGWREYVRGVYWLRMPDYRNANFFEATRDLPHFYWDAQTRMNCLRQCVTETRQNAYAHHIQRLMVLGNFALLAALDPAQVNDWYLLVYADAYEWVELPNVHGMVLFADGGVLASKPYAASGAYIKRMSNYCDGCSYNVGQKNGPKACPFNYLYWDFIDRNADKLRGNPRMGLAYNSLDRMTDQKRKAIRDDSVRFFKALDNGENV
ncbi:cryptochrome/photolyase family protein [Aliiroseovarius zhejiangensis]|uniref:Cryptochrome/photolyase family protein n=1 Tax=Aliiroseovarius zhejiangensis TaxID=1632025 RepID=A0ABQ3IUD4_9RHOB|nr:cryptochrome/photolyase family protein [Aliiroseovarius zhejiangensis]GHE94045.1 cryptochrome/photolyase family protein [Aliiroseovarius zhejiangensis]